MLKKAFKKIPITQILMLISDQGFGIPDESLSKFIKESME
jgi:signal transduction histidine kinase